MPLITVDRIPLPSLKTYTLISVVFLSISVYYAVQVSSEINWKVNGTKTELDAVLKQNNTPKTSWSSNNGQNDTIFDQVQETARFMVQEPFCVWTLVNMAYCCLLLLGTVIQKVVFGDLRVSEQQHVKDKFWNFIFYKFVFVFGIINVQYLHEIVIWCAWFSVLGFLNLLTQLGKDRFEYLSFSPTTSNWNHLRLMSLLIGIFVISGLMLLMCVVVGFFAGFNTFAFMAAECVQLNIKTLHIIMKYSLYLYDMREGGNNATVNWEKRGPIAYYAELIFELTVLILDFAHHLHMLLWSNIFLSIASLVICMQLRHLFHEIQRRIKRHRNYLWVLNHMKQNYPMATAEELSLHKDNCAICWEEMDSARKLPCTHVFHNSCLQSWLEQDTSCPTCRMVLSIRNQDMMDPVTRLEQSLENNADNQQGNRRPNHFFHFDGSRYVSWLPSFSVEVTHTQLGTHFLTPAMQTSQLDTMGRHVQQLFPQIPLSLIIDDLRMSRSPTLTVENILAGRLVVPTHLFHPSNTSTTPPTNPVERPVERPVEHPVEHPAERPAEPSPDARTEEASFWEKSTSATDTWEEESLVSGTFSKSSTEREKLLLKRKEQLLLNARRKYLEKSRKGKCPPRNTELTGN